MAATQKLRLCPGADGETANNKARSSANYAETLNEGVRMLTANVPANPLDTAKI